MRMTILSIALIGLSASHVLAEETQVKLAVQFPPQLPPGQGAYLLAQRAAGTDSLRINLLPPIALSATETLEAVRDGNVDIAILPTQTLARVNKNFEIYSLPFLFGDIGSVLRFQESKDAQSLLRALDRSGLRGLAYWPVEMEQLVSRKPVREANDLRGLKVAGIQPIAAKSVFEALGAKVTDLPRREIVAAFERGLVDASAAWLTEPGAVAGPQNAYINVTNQQYVGAVVVANAAFWNGLSADASGRLNSIIKAVTAEVDDLAIQRTADQIRLFRRAGGQVIFPTGAAFVAWRKDAYKAWSQSGVDKFLVDAALSSGGAEGGGDPCREEDECRCTNRTCSKNCCRR